MKVKYKKSNFNVEGMSESYCVNCLHNAKTHTHDMQAFAASW